MGSTFSLHLGRIYPRAQSYVVLPQAWVSPYQYLHMLPPFGHDVASVAPFSGRLASLPLRQAVTSNRKDLKPSFTEGRNPFRFRGERNTHSLVNICMPQGCDGVQLVVLSIGPLCRHDITRSDRQIGDV